MCANGYTAACNVEKLAEADLLPYMEQRWPTFVYLTRHHKLVQKFCGDVLARDCETAKYIEIKAEQKHTGNLFIEYWSNRHRHTMGWFHICQADWLWYYFVDDRKLYVFQMQELREWARGDKGRLLNYPLVRQNKYDQLNDTWGYLVPVDDLYSALPSFVGPRDPVALTKRPNPLTPSPPAP